MLAHLAKPVVAGVILLSQHTIQSIRYLARAHVSPGYAQASNSSMTAKDFTNDTPRVNYIRDYLTFLASAMRYVFPQLSPVQP